MNKFINAIFFVVFVLGDLIGSLFFLLDIRHRKIATENLTYAFPKLSSAQRQKICHGAFCHLARVSLERLLVWFVPYEYIRDKLLWEGKEKIDKYYQTIEGCVYLTAHIGSWELFTMFGPKEGLLKAVLARKMKEEWVENILKMIREKDGCKVINKGATLKKFLKHLKRGEKIGVLNDQDAGRNGVFIPFFNRPASVHKGMVKVAIKENVDIIPAFLIREKGIWKFRAIVYDPIQYDGDKPLEVQVKDVLTQYNRHLEEVIKRFPEQWLWLHRRWKTQPV